MPAGRISPRGGIGRGPLSEKVSLDLLAPYRLPSHDVDTAQHAADEAALREAVAVYLATFAGAVTHTEAIRFWRKFRTACGAHARRHAPDSAARLSVAWRELPVQVKAHLARELREKGLHFFRGVHDDDPVVLRAIAALAVKPFAGPAKYQNPALVGLALAVAPIWRRHTGRGFWPSNRNDLKKVSPFADWLAKVLRATGVSAAAAGVTSDAIHKMAPQISAVKNTAPRLPR